MSKIRDLGLDKNLLWLSAIDLAGEIPSSRRRGGPNKSGFWISLIIGIVGTIAVFTQFTPKLLSPNSATGFPDNFLFTASILCAVAGLTVALWAGPDRYVRAVSAFTRSLNFAMRFGKIMFVLVLSAFSFGVFIWLEVDKATGNRFTIVFGITILQIIAIAFATSAMRDSVPWVRLNGKRSRIETHSWTLFLWFAACVVFAIGAVTLVARFQNGIATASASLTIAVLLFTTVIRYRVAADGRRESLQTSLATIHRLLISPRTLEGDSGLLEAATELEVVMASPPLVRFTLPHQPAMERELRVCLFFALLNITGLPFTEVRKADGQFLEVKLDGEKDLRGATADFAWLLRDQLVHAATFIKNPDVYQLSRETVQSKWTRETSSPHRETTSLQYPEI